MRDCRVCQLRHLNLICDEQWKRVEIGVVVCTSCQGVISEGDGGGERKDEYGETDDTELRG